MSVKRYMPRSLLSFEHEEGPYVRYDDYVALQTVANHYKGEVGALEAECARLRRELERLQLHIEDIAEGGA